MSSEKVKSIFGPQYSTIRECIASTNESISEVLIKSFENDEAFGKSVRGAFDEKTEVVVFRVHRRKAIA